MIPSLLSFSLVGHFEKALAVTISARLSRALLSSLAIHLASALIVLVKQVVALINLLSWFTLGQMSLSVHLHSLSQGSTTGCNQQERRPDCSCR